MKMYYIKDGFREKGPLTIDEIKKLGISKTTFVRQQDSDSWVQADSVVELRQVFKRNTKFLKVFGFSILVIALIGLGAILIKNINFKSSSYTTYTEIAEPIPTPPTIDFKVTKHKKKILNELFKDCNLTGNKKQLVNACNYTNNSLRNKAVSIAGQSAGNFNLGQVCDIFDYCYNNWKYVNDPQTTNYVEYASTTLNNGLNGDCDDFAVLVCSMILSIGGEARINYAYNPESGHAFTEVNIGNTDINSIENYISKRYKKVYNKNGVWSRTDENGNKWLNLDWFANHPGGQYFDYTHGTMFYIIQGYCNDFTK
ncbi:MAG: transglutaminase domain-containing protein [Brumimicrobium sp.]